VVDMSRDAISARLRTMARLLEERGFTSKGVDMSRSAVTYRLQSMAALSTMCLRLGKAKIKVREVRALSRPQGEES
jgi:hypothetical protein